MTSSKKRFVNLFRLFRLTLRHWREDNCSLLAAGLAYYTTISLAPLSVVGLAVVAKLMGKGASLGQLSSSLSVVVGRPMALSVESLVLEVYRLEMAKVTLVSSLVLLWVASLVFGHLQRTLNIVWHANPRRGVRGALMNKFLSFGMVVGVGFLFIFLTLINAGFGFLKGVLDPLLPAVEFVSLWSWLNLVVLFGVLWGLWTLVYKFLPALKLKWKDVAVGAFVTALLVTLGLYFLGIYFSHVDEYRTLFGRGTSVMVVLIWIYFSCQIFLLGAEFTWAWVHRHHLLGGGSKIGFY